ncbi:hypothetical protein Tco_0542735 [Tanacetum coccineum]
MVNTLSNGHFVLRLGVVAYFPVAYFILNGKCVKVRYTGSCIDAIDGLDGTKRGYQVLCQPKKKKKAKKDLFTIYFHYDGLTELRSNQDIGDMLKVGYENRNAIDMYVEHFGDCEEIENVDFQTEGDESVVIKDISTSNPFLNKLCSARIMFRGTTEHIQTEIPLVDPDENQIDAVNKVKSGVHYPAFDPDIPWDKMQPTLVMRKSLGVISNIRVYQCQNVELSGVPCVHVVAAYFHVGKDSDLGVSHWYSQESWFNAYNGTKSGIGHSKNV